MSTMVIAMSFVMMSGPDVKLAAAHGANKEPHPKGPSTAATQYIGRSLQRHWAWPICKGGVVSPATKAE